MAAARDQAARIVRETANDEVAPEAGAQLADQPRNQITDETRRRPAEAPGGPASEKPAAASANAAKPGKRKFVMMGVLGLLALAAIGYGVYFFLVTGDLYKRKLVKIAGPTFSEKKLTVQILDEINRQIENFMRVQVLTSVLVAVATSLALWWFGLQQYVIWGLLAGVFNSIPYLGPLIVTGGLGFVAFMQFDDIGKTATVCAVAFAITSVEGFLLTPALMSRAARINSAAIFTGLLFWSWVWGVWGTVLAVPMLMMIKAVCDHIEDLQPIGELLGE